MIGIIAAASFGMEMAVSARYGYHRDELYFLQAGQHPALGYVDQPALTPLAAHAMAAATGNTLVGLRVLPALLLAGLVILAAAMSRLLGAGRTGQAVAALATAACGEYLGAAHLFSTTTFDFFFWALTLYLATRLMVSADPRWWVAIGACVGVGMNAKWAVGVLAAALLAGFALTSSRALLRSRYLVAGAVIAAALAWPDLVWQAQHGWPNLAVFHALHGQAGHNMVVYWPAQILYTGFVLTPVWVAGLWWCLRHPAARRFRPAGIAAVITLVLFFVAGGKPYYAGGIYTFLFAAGAVPAERWLAQRPLRPGRAAANLALSTAAVALIALPLLPAATLATVPLQKINYDLAETIGWPRQVALVARVYHALPPVQRATTAILAGNYGEAGAIDRYGPGDGLPPAFSGANNFWYWGPPPARDRSAIAVNIDPALLRRLFTTVREVAVFRNGLGVSDDEQGAVIYRATGLRTSWAKAWPLLRDFS
ncbi:MAG TPA: glycosyltransferase family 39 protein [Streptosporangiaceae bacterium]|nr:glycosyltransferase family 39 protein [Streptosporangiaceae bacterium]